MFARWSSAADEDARAHVRSLFVRPVSIRSRGEKVADGLARRAVRYGNAIAFFMDERSFPEPGGIWLGGARESAVVLQPDEPRSVAAAAGPQRARRQRRRSPESGAWSETLRLAPGEERRVDVPIDPSRGAALVTFQVTSGFRPNEADPTSRDTRFLGAFVRLE